MSDKSVLDSLLEFGLSQTEARIYLFLLSKEPQSVVAISQNLHLPRTSIYDNVLKLIEKGLVEKHVLYKTQKFEAFPISILQDLIDKEKSRVENLEKQYTFLENNIAGALLPNAATQVRYYHGAQGFMQMMWNALSAEKETTGYSVFGRRAVVGEKFTERWKEEIVARHLIDRVITNPTKEIITMLSSQKEIDLRQDFQQTRFLEKEKLYISGDTTIYNNIFSITYWKQGEVVGVEIENEEFVKTQKSIFEQMWKLAKPLTSIKKNFL